MLNSEAKRRTRPTCASRRAKATLEILPVEQIVHITEETQERDSPNGSV